MRMTDIYVAKAKLSKLIQEALDGEEVIISKAGKPLIRLVPYQQNQAVTLKSGYWKDKVKMAKDFVKLPKDIWAAF